MLGLCLPNMDPSCKVQTARTCCSACIPPHPTHRALTHWPRTWSARTQKQGVAQHSSCALQSWCPDAGQHSSRSVPHPPPAVRSQPLHPMALREPGGTTPVTHLPAPSCFPAAPSLAQPLHRATAPGAHLPCSPCAAADQRDGHVLGKLGWRKGHQGWRRRETCWTGTEMGSVLPTVLSSWHPAMHVYKVAVCKGAACSPWAHYHTEFGAKLLAQCQPLQAPSMAQACPVPTMEQCPPRKRSKERMILSSPRKPKEAQGRACGCKDASLLLSPVM